MARESERYAAAVFESIESGWEATYVEDQSRSVFDYWLSARGVRRGAMEVTSLNDPEARAFAAELQNPRKGGRFVQATLCQQGWWIAPVQSANVRELRKRVDAYLRAIEEEGRQRFFAPMDAASSPAVSRIFGELGIEWGTTMLWKPPRRRISISEPGRETVVRPESLREAVEKLTRLADNQAKLGALPSNTRRLLFAVVHPSAYQVWAPLTRQVHPIPSPTLTREVSEVWLAAQFDKQSIVARFKKGRAWRYHVIPTPNYGQ